MADTIVGVMSLRPIDPQSARLFLAIVDEGSIAGAAAREHIVPSAVSRRLAELEARFGVALVERHRRGIRLTPAGESLAHHARMIQQAVQRMQDEMTEYVTGIRGHVRVRASASALAMQLPSHLQAFMRSHERVRLDLEELATPHVFREVAEGRADIGVAPDLVRNEDVTRLPYTGYQLGAVVPRGHPLAGLARVRFSQLLAYDLVELARGSGLANLIDSAAAQSSQIKRTRIRLSGFDGVCRMVANGMGVGILPTFLAAEQARFYRLRFIPIDEPWSRPAVCLIVRRLDTLPSAARALVDHLMACVADDGGRAPRRSR